MAVPVVSTASVSLKRKGLLIDTVAPDRVALPESARISDASRVVGVPLAK